MQDEQNYWLWVTSRSTARASDLKKMRDELGHAIKEPKKGDLILLYLNSKGESLKGYPTSAFRYLIQATSDSYDGAARYPHWRKNGWNGCDCLVLHKFENPVRYKDLKLDPEFQNWDAYKNRNFQGTSFPIPENIWIKLDDMAMERNPGYHGYQELLGFTTPSIESTVKADLDSLHDEEELFDGKKDKRFTTYYERNPKLRSKAIEIHGFKCMTCGFKFADKYGSRGYEYIEVHHLNPVSTLDEATPVDPKTEMAVVCSNCHRMIHRKKDQILSLDELRELIRQNQNNIEKS
jgi:5-methylcytosine-specific restriction endonuclease McrA